MADETLATWRLLMAPDAELQECQMALLRIPGTSTFSFEADPTSTSADLDAVEQGTSLFLDASSPAAKAMTKSIHVGVRVVSKDLSCLGIFNAKEVRVRGDPVVRTCGLPSKGRGACTNTSHAAYKLDFDNPRLLIQTPTVSKSKVTTPAFFSQPYLEVGLLPEGQPFESLIALQAPVGVWRSFFKETPGALRQLLKGPKSEGLKVDTSPLLPTAQDPTSSDRDLLGLDDRPEPPTKEDSPSSYELVGMGATEPVIGSQVRKTSSAYVDDVSSVGSGDSAGSEVDLLGTSTAKLGMAMGAGLMGLKEEEVYSTIPTPSDYDARTTASGELERHYRPSPPAGASVKSVLSSGTSVNDQADVHAHDASQPVLILLQNMENRLHLLELENKDLKERHRQVKSVAQQAIRATVAQATPDEAVKQRPSRIYA